MDDVNGGYVSGYAGNGGKVELKLKLEEHALTNISVGTQGTRGPKTAVGTNNSGGYGGGYGGDGDWGTRNYGYGGGGSSEIRFGFNEDCRSIVAGGGGATRKSKELAGHGGNGGCTNANDSRCKGYYGTTYSNGATQSSGNGADSVKGEEQGGGGGGWMGGAAGSTNFVGGNAGTSKIDTSCYNFEYRDVKYTIGAYPNNSAYLNGYVRFEVLKRSEYE